MGSFKILRKNIWTFFQIKQEFKALFENFSLKKSVPVKINEMPMYGNFAKLVVEEGDFYIESFVFS